MQKNLYRLESDHLLRGFCMAAFFLAAPLASPADAANCTMHQGAVVKQLAFQIPSSFTVPRDAPIGTVIYESAPITNSAQDTPAFTCTAAFRWGLVNSVGGIPPAATKVDMPIGNTGLAWGLVYDNKKSTPAPLPAASLGIQQVANTHTFVSTSFSLRIRKIGPVAPGAAVEAGLLGYVNMNDEFNVFIVRTSTKASVTAQSCKTPDVIVQMGDRNRVGQFKGVGTSLAPVSLSINLNECPSGISKVSYLLKPNTQILDAAQSVVALDAESVAKGVGLQVLNQNGEPAVLNEKIAFSEYDKAGGNFSIPLKAAYRQTAPVVGAGTANSSLTFVMSYE